MMMRKTKEKEKNAVDMKSGAGVGECCACNGGRA